MSHILPKKKKKVLSLFAAWLICIQSKNFIKKSDLFPCTVYAQCRSLSFTFPSRESLEPFWLLSETVLKSFEELSSILKTLHHDWPSETRRDETGGWGHQRKFVVWVSVLSEHRMINHRGKNKADLMKDKQMMTSGKAGQVRSRLIWTQQRSLTQHKQFTN